MPTLHLHIGTLKTGTTSLQSFLTRNRENLLKNGCLYPKSGAGKSDQHRFFFQTIASKRPDNLCTDKRIEEWENLEKEVALHQPKHVVISAEGICSFDADEVKLLRSYLSRFLSRVDIKIIIYLRRQDNLLVSLYAQRVKAGRYWGSLKDFYEEGILSPNAYIHGDSFIRDFKFDYYELLKPWAEIFGKDNIIVRSYDKEKKRLIDSFLEAIGCDEKGDLEYLDFNKNQTISGKKLKIIRLFNYIARGILSKSLDECEKLYIRRFLFARRGKAKTLIDLVENLPDVIFSSKLASNKLLSTALANFESANRKVAQHYLGSAKLF